MKPETCYVVSGTYDQFANYAIEQTGLNQGSKHFVYVRDENSLLGLRDIKGVFIGTWYNRKDIDSILLMLTIASSSITGITTAYEVLKQKRKFGETK